MDIAKVGQERDRQIAELLHDGCLHFSALPVSFGGNGPACRKNAISFPDACCREGEQYCLAYEDKPYSTDIATAFELFDEMKAEGQKYSPLEISWFRGSCIMTLVTRRGTKITFTGGSVADAISGAYLKWNGRETS